MDATSSVSFNAGKRLVAVVSDLGPERALAITLVLQDQIDRHGWSERLGVVALGLGRGAGRAADSALAVLERAGLGACDASCADAARDPALLEAGDVFVVATAAEADALLEYPAADGKFVLALTDMLDDPETSLGDPLADLDSVLADLRAAAPALLRQLTAAR